LRPSSCNSFTTARRARGRISLRRGGCVGYKECAMSTGLRIKDLPPGERPRERLAEKGADALSHAEASFQVAENVRRQAEDSLKNARKMEWIAESGLMGHLFDERAGLQKQFGGSIHFQTQ